MVTPDKATDRTEKLVRLNPRVNPKQLEEVLEIVRAIFGKDGASRPKGVPYPFGRGPRRPRSSS